jgi:alpha/beta superfamily hydrolase
LNWRGCFLSLKISILERAASAKKELVRIEGATHVSLYDKDADKAVEKLAGFFKKNL